MKEKERDFEIENYHLNLSVSTSLLTDIILPLALVSIYLESVTRLPNDCTECIWARSTLWWHFVPYETPLHHRI